MGNGRCRGKMITLIPYQTFEIKTRLRLADARQKLQEIVEPRKFMRLGLSRNHNLFEGEMEGESFKISRIIHYRNGFLPILVGKIQDDLDASTLKVTARPTWFIILFWTFFMLAVGAGGAISGDLLEDPWMLLLLFLFFYGLPTALFNFEVYQAKKLLDEKFATALP